MIKEPLALQSVFKSGKCFLPLPHLPQPTFEDEAGIIEKGKLCKNVIVFKQNPPVSLGQVEKKEGKREEKMEGKNDGRQNK